MPELNNCKSIYEATLTCDKCDKKMEDIWSYRKHKSSCPKAGITCERCGYALIRENLAKHMFVCSGPKGENCDGCGIYVNREDTEKHYNECPTSYDPYADEEYIDESDDAIARETGYHPMYGPIDGYWTYGGEYVRFIHERPYSLFNKPLRTINKTM